MALDVSCEFCEFAAQTPGGRRRHRRTVATRIPQLREAVQSIRRPRILVLEEGPMADWLFRNLREHVDDLIVCDPRRNHLIANDGDKDDPIDAEKLLELARGNHLRRVHHPPSDGQAILKRHVALYHDQVGERVRAGLKAIWYLRWYGIVVKLAAIEKAESRAAIRRQLPARRSVRQDLRILLERYDLAVSHEHQLHRDLRRMAQRIDPIRRFTAIPGISWIRGATFYAYIDTPWRFRSKQALWKYVGIGLERRRSGGGKLKQLNRLGVPRRCNFVLKNVIHGAAKSAIRAGNNPFADQYERWIQDGRTPLIARRNVARSLAAVMWGMWKNQTDYRPEWVGRSA
jgi:transposase